MGDGESRLLALEARLWAALASSDALMARLAALEQTSWQTGGGGGGSGGGSGDVLRLAFTSGGVTASSGTTAGTGTVTLYDINPSTGALTAGNTATVMNGLLSSVPASKWIYVAIQLNSDGTECLVVPAVSCA
jgi:hypothetical protein